MAHSNNQETHGLKSKFQIGSIHGTLNYSYNNKAFHSHDVPENARLKKKEVKQSKNRNILALAPPNWNSRYLTNI